MNEMIDNTRETVIWIKPVLGKPNFLITNTGAVWSREKNMWLKLYKTGEGHLQVVLDDDSYHPFVHRLVFEAFVRPLRKGQVVHHKNEIKDDNRVENLSVMMRSEHTIKHHLGQHHSQQTKQKISLSEKGKTAWNKGASLSQEHKNKISQTLKGRPIWNKGSSLSQEHKNKIRQALKGRKHSQQHKRKIVEARKRNKNEK